MDVEDAAALIAPGVRVGGRSAEPAAAWWADLGVGQGTFTRALARLLGPAGRVAAVDRDPAAVAALAGGFAGATAPVRLGTRPSAFGGTTYAAVLERRS